MFLSPSQRSTQHALSGSNIRRRLTATGAALLARGAWQLAASFGLAVMLITGTAGGVNADETSAGVTTNTAAMSFFKEGTGKLGSGDNSGALVAFTQAITLDPKFYKAYANRCASRINLHDYKGALEDINVALKCFPNEPKVLALKTQAEQLLQNQANGNSNNNNNQQQEMAQERAAAARRALAQAMIGGDFADPSTMIMMQAQRRGLMNGNAGAARPVVNPFAPRVAPEGSSGKDNPFTVHSQPETSSASSTNNSPFAQSSNYAAQSIIAGVASSSGSDSPFDQKKTEASDAPKADGGTVADNLPLTARLTTPAGKVGSGRIAAKRYFDLGCAKADSRNFASAIEEFGQAISHDDNYGEAYVNRGLSRFHNRDFQGALTDFQRAEQLITNNAPIKSFIQSAKRALDK